jgi:hypothetical protein
VTALDARTGPFVQFAPLKNPAQSLVVYDIGAGGEYTGEFARYGIPQLNALEASPADGVASAPAFDSDGLPVFLDESSNGGFGLFEQPNGSGEVDAQQLFYGVPCVSTSLAVDAKGDYYVAQYCSGQVLEFSPSRSKKAKKPIAVYSGGNFGGKGQPDPTVAAVDHSGNLYVGDYTGGITFFAAGSRKPVVAFPTGMSQPVTQIFIDASGDAWSTHLANATSYYFKNDKTCTLDPKGTVVRNEVGERFSNGQLVAQLYSAQTTSQYYAPQGESIAVDKGGRTYLGADGDGQSVVLAYDSGQYCPNLNQSLLLDHGADPQLAVDAGGLHYVSDYVADSLASYKSGATTPLAQITQATGFVNPTHMIVGP